MQKKKLKKFSIIFSSVFIYIFTLPLAFAKSATNGAKMFFTPGDSVETSNSGNTLLTDFRKSVYDSLHLDLAGLSRQAFDYARKGFNRLLAEGKLNNDSVITIADFTQPSNKKRLYVVDMKNYRVLHQTLVAHGRNTGDEWARNFSNAPSSHMSSPGFYVTADTYMGGNGYSLRLIGLEKGINDRALSRTIVIHGANYVSHERAGAGGFIGRSWGCPAIPMQEAKPIINRIKDGSMLFIYTTDESYTSRSSMI